MKSPLNLTAALILFFCSSPFSCFSQQGTLKVFSEIKGINVYLDEELKGIDIITIDSVAIGSHYLKVVKDNVIVFGELITIAENAVTTALIKDSEQVQNKLKQEQQRIEREFLESKSEAIKQYKEQRLDVLFNTRYVTETSTASQSKYYPGYYSSSGNTASNTVSETKAYTDWFITQGGKQISYNTFAQIVGDQKKLEDIEIYNKKIKGKRLVRGLLGTPILLGGIVGGGYFIVAIIAATPWVLPAVWYLGGTVTGMMILIEKPSYTSLSYSSEEAKQKSTIFNQQLKKELGLPTNFEP